MSGQPQALPSLAAGALVFFTSGAVLMLEILAGRLLAPYVGVSLETYTGIIGVVLAGIALGTWLGGRAADRIPPRRLLGPLLTWGGAMALLAVPAITLVGELSLQPGPEAIIGLSLVGFFAPAAVLSAITPVVVKLQLSDLSVTGSVVGRLSALGTTGAILGTFITGFVLIAAFPSRPIVVVVGSAFVIFGLAFWVALGVRRDMGAVVLSLVLAGSGALATGMLPGSCQWESAYYCVRIEDDPQRAGGRTLWLDQLRHSYVDVHDPAHLEFQYTRLFAHAIDAHRPPGEPVSALHLGGGGLSMPRYLRDDRPGSTGTVLEIDPLLVELAIGELGYLPGPDVRIETGDARLTLRREPAGRYDVVLGDAFGGLSVPWHLTTADFLAELRRAMTADGLYVLNLIDYNPLHFARSQLATLRGSFEHVAFISAPGRQRAWAGGTFIMLASDRPIAAERLAAALEDRRWQLQVVSQAAELEQFIGEAMILRDDFAPVDQLISQPDFW